MMISPQTQSLNTKPKPKDPKKVKKVRNKRSVDTTPAGKETTYSLDIIDDDEDSDFKLTEMGFCEKNETSIRPD